MIVTDWKVFRTQLLELSFLFAVYFFQTPYLRVDFIFYSNQKDWNFETNFWDSVRIRLRNNTAFLILHWILKTILDKYPICLALSWYCFKLVYYQFKWWLFWKGQPSLGYLSTDFFIKNCFFSAYIVVSFIYIVQNLLFYFLKKLYF